MKISEKVVLLAGLFHDAGRFIQICDSNEKRNHKELAVSLIEENSKEFTAILDNDTAAVDKLKTLILNHHSEKGDDTLLNALIDADRISSGIQNLNKIDEEFNGSSFEGKKAAVKNLVSDKVLLRIKEKEFISLIKQS